MPTAPAIRAPHLTAVLREGDRVTPLELFFDLVFVLALTQCTTLMSHDTTWEGLVKGLLDGVAYGTIRTVTGAAEVATFWSPLPVKYQPPIQEPAASPLERR